MGNAEIDRARRRRAAARVGVGGKLLDRAERSARVLLASRRGVRMHVER